MSYHNQKERAWNGETNPENAVSPVFLSNLENHHRKQNANNAVITLKSENVRLITLFNHFSTTGICILFIEGVGHNNKKNEYKI